MRDDVYKEFSSKIKSIIKDCMVPKELADTSSEKYWHHDMHIPINKGKTLYYDRNKVESHKDELRQLISIIPQKDIR